MLPTLYELATEFHAAAERLADIGLDEQTVADTLEGLEGDLKTKAANIARLIGHLDATADALIEVEKRKRKYREAIQARATRLRAYLLNSLKAGGIYRFDAGDVLLARRLNPPKVVIDDASLVPAPFWRFPEPPPPEIAKAEVKRALSADPDAVPGAHLEQSERLDIE